ALNLRKCVDFLVLTQLAAVYTAERGILAAIINPALNAAGLIIADRLHRFNKTLLCCTVH
ncbi:MAG TPA: hypothetical protein PKE57_13085, partial [Cellvibrionaceae bacterium]|nr:hypothetical protein [Cellvibrionaceae bacterium]